MIEAETLGDAVPPLRLLACPKCGASYSNLAHRCGIDGEKLVTPTQDFLIGRVVDRYRIVDRIGVGAMGCVYRAIHTELETEVALKVLLGELGADDRFVARFRREAQILHQTSHPNVVRVLDYGRSKEGLAYMVMELLPGRTLEVVLETEAPLPPDRVVVLARGLAAALGAIHARGFVHRDVKPANVMIGPSGDAELRLLDFGIAGKVDATKGTKLTATGKILGTPTYMAPEQAEDALVTPAADLYSLGAILYEALSGAPPFTGNRLGEVLVKHATLAPPPLPFCDGLEVIVLGLLAKAPAARPQSAAELIGLLDDWSQARGPTADPSPPPALPAARRRWPWAVAAAGILGFGLGRVPLLTPIAAAPEVAPNAPAPPVAAPTPLPLAQVELTAPAVEEAEDQAAAEGAAAAEQALSRALEGQGLLLADLPHVPGLKVEFAAYKRSSRGSEARARAAAHLSRGVGELARLEPALFSAKLDRSLRRLQKAQDHLPAGVVAEYEERLLAAGARLRSTLSPAEGVALAKELTEIERRLSR
ncbi:MAG: serine/threonine protein kinase [Deltaproteobacteria bacterium]|nr:serine/threonine protein kinase [Deltaproteobacteria bacterium]